MDETSVYLDRPSGYTYSKKVILSYLNNFILRFSNISLIKKILILKGFKTCSRINKWKRKDKDVGCF